MQNLKRLSAVFSGAAFFWGVMALWPGDPSGLESAYAKADGNDITLISPPFSVVDGCTVRGSVFNAGAEPFGYTATDDLWQFSGEVQPGESDVQEMYMPLEGPEREKVVMRARIRGKGNVQPTVRFSAKVLCPGAPPAGVVLQPAKPHLRGAQATVPKAQWDKPRAATAPFTVLAGEKLSFAIYNYGNEPILTRGFMEDHFGAMHFLLCGEQASVVQPNSKLSCETAVREPAEIIAVNQVRGRSRRAASRHIASIEIVDPTGNVRRNVVFR